MGERNISARVCSLSNKQGESINFRPVHSIMINNTTNEDYSGNYHKLLEIQVVSLYSNSVPQRFPIVAVLSSRRPSELCHCRALAPSVHKSIWSGNFCPVDWHCLQEYCNCKGGAQWLGTRSQKILWKLLLGTR